MAYEIKQAKIDHSRNYPTSHPTLASHPLEISTKFARDTRKAERPKRRPANRKIARRTPIPGERTII